MSDSRQIVYRLRAVADASSAAAIKKFGRDIHEALNPRGMGGGSMFAKVGEGLRVASKAGKDLESQMKRLNDAHTKRISAEERASAKAVAGIDKEIAALRKREAAEEAAMRRDEAREHKRHRMRQRSTAIAGRAMRESLDDLGGYVGGGAVRRPASMDRLTGSGSSQSNLRTTVNRTTESITQLSHGVLQLGLLSEKSSEQLLRGIVAVEGGMHIGRGLVGLGPVGAGVAAAGGVALAGTSAIGFGRDVAAFGLGGGSAPGSFNDKAGGMMARAGASLYERMGGDRSSFASAFLGGGGIQELSQSNRALRRQQAGASIEEMRIGRSVIDQEGITASMQHRSEALGMGAAALTDQSLGSGWRANRVMIGDAERGVAEAKASESSLRTEREKAEARNRGAQAQQRLIGLLQEEQRLTADVTRDLLSRSDAHRQAGSEAAGRYTSAAERFGNLSRVDQFRAVRLKRRADEAERADLAAGGRSRIGSDIRRSMSREDTQFLASIGDAQGERFAKQSALQRAERGGFGVAGFGLEEQRAAQFHGRAAQNLERLAVNIQPPKMEVNITPDAKVMADALTGKILNSIEQWAKIVEGNITRKVEGDKATLNKSKTSAGAIGQQQSKNNLGPGAGS